MIKRNLLLTGVVCLALTAGIYAYFNESDDTTGSVTYVQDPVNSCTWKDGKIESTTKVGYAGKMPEKTIMKSEEKAFIEQVSKTHQCWYEK
ncbi:MAG: SipW-dependent-type signal peptide-containing protein [bacterium]|nr:SipW-dependent-type signal peptide-containing protein [bacterium]